MNHSLLELDMIVYNKKYSFIYSWTCIVLFIFVISLYILFLCDYHTYYQGIGIIKGQNLLEIHIYDQGIDTILEKNIIEIEDTSYYYQVSYIDNNTYLDNNNHNYQKVFLKVDNLNYVENKALNFKVEGKKQKIIYHILDYLERS